MGGEDGPDLVDFSDGEWIERVARDVGDVAVAVARGFKRVLKEEKLGGGGWVVREVSPSVEKDKCSTEE